MAAPVSIDDHITNSRGPEMRGALLLEEYRTLRTEIMESIKHQHQILLLGYGAALSVLSYATKEGSKETLSVAPWVALVMSSLWTTECNRMVRAGNYIGFLLWPQICKESCYDLLAVPDPDSKDSCYNRAANWEF